ncbi:hypothetical protein ACIQF6_28850 [Kitasatospora sp. NPDC092948]|uniref:hypothetical protein n=1 Tax=Kitasatospora sp. NPDC092948 TaxID=3364088 RepID=UPI0038133666
MPTSATEPEAEIPDHCEACGSTDREHTEDRGYSGCCNEPVCPGPWPVDYSFRAPRRYLADPCCDSDPRYAPALLKAVDNAKIGRHHGIGKPRGVENALDLFLPQDLAREHLRRVVASLRRDGWHCRPERIDTYQSLPVVRIEVGPERSGQTTAPQVANEDQVLQLAGFSPYRPGRDRAPFWGYTSDFQLGNESWSVHIGAHGPEGVGSAEAAEESEAMQQALREAGWTVQPALSHSFNAFAPLSPSA